MPFSSPTHSFSPTSTTSSLTWWVGTPSAFRRRQLLPPISCSGASSTPLADVRMIATTYALSGLLLALTGALFAAGVLSATWQTVAWTIIFFFASVAASSAYLTVSAMFPLRDSRVGNRVLYAVGTGIGGVGAPWLFGALIDTSSRVSLFGRVFFRGGTDACRSSDRTSLRG